MEKIQSESKKIIPFFLTLSAVLILAGAGCNAAPDRSPETFSTVTPTVKEADEPVNPEMKKPEITVSTTASAGVESTVTVELVDPVMPSTPEVKTFVIDGTNFAFAIKGQTTTDLRVKQGDRVKIVFNNMDGFHDWKVDEFKAATQKIKTGETSSVEFVADKKGTFEYYCSVGQHRMNGMKGNLIIE